MIPPGIRKMILNSSDNPLHSGDRLRNAATWYPAR